MSDVEFHTTDLPVFADCPILVLGLFFILAATLPRARVLVLSTAIEEIEVLVLIP